MGWRNDEQGHTLARMRRRKILGFAVLGLTLLVFLLASWPNLEPIYNGKPLRYWLKGYKVAGGNWNDSTTYFADEAVRHLGTNAVPTLLKMLQSDNSGLDVGLWKVNSTLRKWAQRLHIVKINPIARLPSYDCLEATMAFERMSPDTSLAVSCQAVAGLIKLEEAPPPPHRFDYTHQVIPLILAHFGRSAKDAVPVLVAKLDADHGDEAVRGNTLFALGQIGCDHEKVIPILINGLHDPSAYVRKSSASALEMFGTEAKSAVPELMQVIASMTPQQRSMLSAVMKGEVRASDDPSFAAAQALKAIDRTAAVKAGVP